MIIPILRSFDEGKLRAFYLDYLGFVIDWEHRFGPDMPLYLQVSRGTGSSTSPSITGMPARERLCGSRPTSSMPCLRSGRPRGIPTPDPPSRPCPGAAASCRCGIPSVTGWCLPSRCRRKKTPNKKTGADGSRFFICLLDQAASCSALSAGSPLWAKRSAHRAITPSPVTLQAVPKLSWAR